LLKKKIKPQFDWTVDRAVEGFFRAFLTSNRVQFFQLPFFRKLPTN